MGLQAHFANFIEEERAARGGTNQPRPIFVGTGKRAAAIAEQLAVDHFPRHGGAVERQEGSILARRREVQRAREQFLADAGFSGDEDGQA